MDLTQEMTKTPMMVVATKKENEIASALPLEHTIVDAKVVGFAAHVTIRQQYRNPFTAPMDLEYLFPLHHEAAVIGFVFRIGERVVKSSLQEKKEAEKQFAKAAKQGKRAALMSQRLRNLFGMQLANVQPGDAIEAEITYLQRVDYVDGKGEFVFPMGITPKYHSDLVGEPEENIDAPVAMDKEDVGDVQISLNVYPGAAVSGFTSHTHAISSKSMGEGAYHVELDGNWLPDRDFVLRWSYAAAQVQLPAWRQPNPDGNGGSFMAVILPPALDANLPITPRDFIFVLDRSGSMSGEPMAQARNAVKSCLRSLEGQDRFAVIAFDERVEIVVPMTRVSQAAIEAADKAVSRIDARGGTEILAALKTALTMEQESTANRIVVFLTDGAVSGETEALRMVEEHLGNARLFTFGIGASVDRNIISRLAKIGGGVAEFVGELEEIEEAMLRFQDRVNFPQMLDLDLKGVGAAVYDILPGNLPDLYSGSVVEVFGKYAGDGSKLGLVLKGLRAGMEVEVRVDSLSECPVAGMVGQLAAKRQIDELGEKRMLRLAGEREVREEVLRLALANGLASDYTSFVAVDESERKDTTGKLTVTVAQPLPENVNFGIDYLDSPLMPNYYNADVDYDLSEGSAGPQVLYRMSAPAPSEINPMSYQMMKDEILEFRNPSIGKMSKKVGSRGNKIDYPIRNLLRSQMLDGSWKGDVALTSAICLGFLMGGHSHVAGQYRKQLGKALAWLAAQAPTGTNAYWRKAAITAFEHAADPSLAGLGKYTGMAPAPSKDATEALLDGLSVWRWNDGAGFIPSLAKDGLIAQFLGGCEEGFYALIGEGGSWRI